jgi:hypothetical protein
MLFRKGNVGQEDPTPRTPFMQEVDQTGKPNKGLFAGDVIRKE